MDIELEQNKEELSEEGLEGSCKPEENLANQTKAVQTKEAEEACLMQECDTLDKVIISTEKSALRFPSVKKQLVSVCGLLKAKQALLEDIAAEQLKEELRLGYALSNTVPYITPTFVPTSTAIGSTEADPVPEANKVQIITDAHASVDNDDTEDLGTSKTPSSPDNNKKKRKVTSRLSEPSSTSASATQSPHMNSPFENDQQPIFGSCVFQVAEGL
ncbi:unnamed protein product [Calypogeia fissa]